jgi:hypothetical protein
VYFSPPTGLAHYQEEEEGLVEQLKELPKFSVVFALQKFVGFNEVAS